jgi:superoxide dismutase, Cu-Zn family
MYRNILGGSALLLALVACGGGEQESEVAVEETAAPAEAPAAAPAAGGSPARATFINDQGTEIGTATLTPEGNGVRVDVDLAFLQAGEKGFHIHEVGSCTAPAFEDAGAHFNPTNAQHGNLEAGHAGDMENLEVETDDGTARGSWVNNKVTLASGQPNSLLDADGSALVVHVNPDDHTTQPSGNSGTRIACGIITAG